MLPSLNRSEVSGLGLWSDFDSDARTSFAFAERIGGVSSAPFDTLNLGLACGDDPEAVAENERRLLAALAADPLRCIRPKQVHGDHIVDVGKTTSLADARAEAAQGADALVVTQPGVSALLCFADCVPVLIVAPDGFALAHSGWKGTRLEIAKKSALRLMRKAMCRAQDLKVYIGPHIGALDYEVSEELAAEFAHYFGEAAVLGRYLDLSFCIRQSLKSLGIQEEQIAELSISTAEEGSPFFSYRATEGHCGRHAAIAYLRS